MQSLLRWAIENLNEDGAPPPQRTLDPDVITHILGKSDVQQMHEALEIAEDASQEEDRRRAALDDLEMVGRGETAQSVYFLFFFLPLIRHTPSLWRTSTMLTVPHMFACVTRFNPSWPDLVQLNMWARLHGLLSAAPTTDPLRMQTLWVIGTALQNNPAAQLAVSPHLFYPHP